MPAGGSVTLLVEDSPRIDRKMTYLIQVYVNGRWAYFWTAYTLLRARRIFHEALDMGYPTRAIDASTHNVIMLSNKNGKA